MEKRPIDSYAPGSQTPYSVQPKPAGGYNPGNVYNAGSGYNPYSSGAPVRPVYPTPVYTEEAPTGKYKPLGAWAYFGYNLLFSIPLVGFICLIIFSFSDSNINRRNYARSYWCAMLVGMVLFVLGVVLLVSTGALANLEDLLYSTFYY